MEVKAKASRARRITSKPKSKLTEITLDQLKTLVDEMVEDKLADILGDTDRGLEFSEEMKREIQQARAEFKKGERGIAAEDLARELGLKP